MTRTLRQVSETAFEVVGPGGRASLVCDPARLPLRSSAFDRVESDRLHVVADDVLAVTELARVARRSATIALTTPNRRFLVAVWRKQTGRLGSARANDRARYQRGEFEALVRTSVRIRHSRGAADPQRKTAPLTSFLGRWLSRDIVLSGPPF